MDVKRFVINVNLEKILVFHQVIAHSVVCGQHGIGLF